jgi:hypothetical protein
MKAKHRMQRLVIDESGVIRFQMNTIVRMLVDEHKDGLNDIAYRVAIGEFPKVDYEHLMMLIGYSVSGSGDCNNVRKSTVKRANKLASRLLTEAQDD